MIEALIDKLLDLNIGLELLEQDNLKIHTGGASIPASLLEEIKLHKADIISYLKTLRQEDDFRHIPNVPEQDSYALSAAQKRLWILSQFHEANVGYNIPGAYMFDGNLDIAALEHAFGTVITRHESLRTVFREDKAGLARQYILSPETAGFSIRQVDLRRTENTKEQLEHLVTEEFARAFNLSKESLLRVSLFQTDDNKWVLTYVMHHIISDGWSMGVLMNEVMALYDAHTKNLPDPLPPLRIHYKDFAAWQDVRLSGAALQEHKDWWLNQFDGDIPVLELPSDKIRPAVKTYNGSRITRLVNAERTSGLKSLCLEHGATLFMGLMAVANALFYRYSQQEDIVIGTPMAGRDHKDLENQIGFYVNTLALRNRFSGAGSFLALLAGVKQVVIGAHNHQDFPFDELVELLKLKRDMSRNPLFDVQVILQNTMMPSNSSAEDDGSLKADHYTHTDKGTIVFDLVFNFVEMAEGLHLEVMYNSDIYDRLMVDQLALHFEQILSAILSDPLKPLMELDFLSAEEKGQQLHAFNDNTVKYPEGQTLIDLFREQVERTPDNMAVVCGNQSLTYQQLDKASGKLAAYLKRTYCTGAGDLVGVLLNRSVDMIISILGIMKAGAAYVPVDPEYPRQRKEFIVRDAGIRTLITQTDYLFEVDYFNGSLFAIDVQLSGLDDNNIITGAEVMPHDLAYIIYTSGSTGTPKGVMVEHAGVTNTVRGIQTVFAVGAEDRGLQFASASFDASIWDVFLMLTSGGALHVVDDTTKKNPALLEHYIEENAVTVASFPPAYLQLLHTDSLRGMKQLITGGEAAIAENARAFTAYGRYHNVYGPTEGSIWATTFTMLHPDDLRSARVPIGRPAPNVKIYILDARQQLLPPGVPGEICIGGAGVARGYLNNEELTAARFVADPFRPGERMYRTGDIGRWLPDGNIDFVGRKDDQVKINGFRIELGEIDLALQTCPGVTGAVVQPVRNAGGGRELVAYITGERTLSVTDIRASLANMLPAYMVPHHFVQLDEFPLTTNGKIDRKRLPDPLGLSMDAGVQYTAPRNEMESHLVAAFEEVLKKQPLGINENFFVLGGDSIKSIQIVSQLKQKGYSLAFQHILQHPVIADLATHITLATRQADQEVVQGPVALSPVQQFFFSTNTAAPHHYNQSVLLMVNTHMEETEMKAVLDRIVLHHDALRMVFRQTPDGWQQENRGPAQTYSFDVITVANEDECRHHCDVAQASFELATGPLFRVVLFRHPAGDRLLLAAHHLVIDGVSWRILFEDLSALIQQYRSGQQLSLPLKTDSYKYWQEKNLEYIHSQALLQEDAYWLAISREKPAPLPLDLPQGRNCMGDMVSCSFALSETETTRLLTQCYQAYQTEINDVLLTALGLAIEAVFGLQKMLVLLEGHGREQVAEDVDISRTVGWFTSMCPVMLQLGYNKDVSAQLIHVKETLRRVPNKGVGYGLLNYLADKQYNIRPEIAFNYLGDFGSGIATASGDQLFGFTSAYRGREWSNNIERSTVLDISGMVAGGQLQLSVDYSAQQFETATIERLTQVYKQQLMELVEHLSSIPAGAAPETTLLPVSYNQQLYFSRLEIYDQLLVGRHVFTNMDIGVFTQAVATLVERHEVLRTVFVMENGAVKQQVISAKNFHFKPGEIPVSSAAEIEQQILDERRKQFDLFSPPLFNVKIYKLPEGAMHVLFLLHHSIADGYSMGILQQELMLIYTACLEQKQPTLPLLPSTYHDYVQWQAGFLNSAEALQHEAYWQEKLSGWEPGKLLTGQHDGAVCITELINGPLFDQLDTFAKTNGITRSSLLLGVLMVLWGRLDGKDDVAVMTAVSGRNSRYYTTIDVPGIIGLFANPLLVRNTVDGDLPAITWIRQVQRGFTDDLNYSAYPFAKLIAIMPALSAPDLLRQTVYYNYHNYTHLKDAVYTGSHPAPQEITGPVDYPLGLSVSEYRNCLKLELVLSKRVFHEEELHAVKEHYLFLLKEIMQHPALLVKQLQERIAMQDEVHANLNFSK
ncbi:MAG TPA: amino acid adenylation domain-containing protein [Chitinophaga sp.]|uniref:non-ribosomal peptide synthetase n=1 Tax=Chitinophaga sp. TaxID=1869181 RepID=UPI002C0FAE62|nr:non-ribosomal peptide synthetase [Chitinophaga sp.]HVI44933.1 amino acid adenylation domain-containing protein [Chitinophaga sp.]